MGKFYIEISDNTDDEGNIVEGDVTFTFAQEEEAPAETEAKMYFEFLGYLIESGNLKQFASIWLNQFRNRGRIEEVDAPTNQAAPAEESGIGAPAI